MRMTAVLPTLAVLVAALSVPGGALGAATERRPLARASAVEVTILSSNLASAPTIGEWGLSALVQVDGRCVLFDAGRHPDTVLRNAEALRVDLSCVTDVVLSHHHFDHTTGLLPLLDELRPANPDAIRRVHVARGFLQSRRIPQRRPDAEANSMIAVAEQLQSAGVELIVHDAATELLPGVWVTGPVSRPHPEKNYPDAIRIRVDGEWVPDPVPESQALSVLTDDGHIVLLGCGHSGVVNALSQIRRDIADEPIHALMGGLHLFAASDQVLGWTADRLREIGVEHLMAGHCTGIEPLFRLRAGLDLSRRTAVVGAVGSRFVYGEGIRPTAIAM